MQLKRHFSSNPLLNDSGIYRHQLFLLVNLVARLWTQLSGDDAQCATKKQWINFAQGTHYVWTVWTFETWTLSGRLLNAKYTLFGLSLGCEFFMLWALAILKGKPGSLPESRRMILPWFVWCFSCRNFGRSALFVVGVDWTATPNLPIQ
jgi:hypothetical protein